MFIYVKKITAKNIFALADGCFGIDKRIFQISSPYFKISYNYETIIVEL